LSHVAVIFSNDQLAYQTLMY